jgi:hypothetical protein
MSGAGDSYDGADHMWRRVVDIQIEGMRHSIEDLQGRMDASDHRLSAIDSNTTEVVEILRDWKGAMSVLKFISKVIAPIGAIATVAVAVWTAITAFRSPPH